LGALGLALVWWDLADPLEICLFPVCVIVSFQV